jgi:bacteriocin-like protein
MTDLNREIRELSIDELTINELDAVTGGDLLNRMIDSAVQSVWVMQGAGCGCYKPTIGTELR